MPDGPSSKKARREAKKAEKKGQSSGIIGNSSLRQMENTVFTAYYKRQLPEDYFNADVEACLRTPLPVTWRFSGHDEGALGLRSGMEVSVLPKLRAGDEAAAVPHPLPWYPDRLAWQFDVSRAQLRGKDWEGADAPGAAGRSDAVKAFHAWLMREQDLGNVHRQEAVSMVPPLLLDIKPGHAVLDMCAAPGSKAQQILEMLSTQARFDGGSEGGGGSGRTSPDMASGLLVANDADLKRCHLLASRAGRLNSPSLVVTNHDARLIPESLGEGDVAAPLLFDRVSADVPCSGDGTLRKNPLIWKRWNAAPGNMLHSLQLQIACKAVRLLKVGGRLAYSTCSLNPIENEAVVARLLETFGPGCLQLVDVSTKLPALRRRPGLNSWAVWHRGQWHETWESVVERFPTKCPRLESLFPPPAAAKPLSEGGLGLERCARLMPHDIDGGGFFIAILEKVADHAEGAGALPDDTPEVCVTEGGGVVPEELSTTYDAEAAASAGKKRKDAGGGAGGGETSSSAAAAGAGIAAAGGDSRSMWSDSMATMTTLHAHGGCNEAAVLAAACNGSYAPLFLPQPAMVTTLTAFYGLGPSFPADRLLLRSPTAKSLLLVSDEVLRLVRSDSGTGRLRIVNTGVHLLERETAKGAQCDYRLCQDGLSHMLPHVTKQRVACTPEAAARLLTCKQSISNEELKASEGLSALADELKRTCVPGSVAITCENLGATAAGGGGSISFVALYAVSGGLGPMVKPLERHNLLFRMGVEAPANEQGTGSAGAAKGPADEDAAAREEQEGVGIE